MGEIIIKLMTIIENLLVIPLIWACPIKWTIVIPGSSAVKFTFGIPGEDLGAGIHFATTGQTFQHKHVRTNFGVAESMYVLTEDGLSIRVRGVIVYRITSLVKYITSTEDSDQFVVEACEAAIRYAISNVPYEDLVNDSDSVEQTISKKISEICEDLGIHVIRYRFQDIEIIDPIGRGLASAKAMSPGLIESAIHISKKLQISPRDALAILSPNIQFVVDIFNSPKVDTKTELGGKNES